MKQIDFKKFLLFISIIFVLGVAGFAYYNEPWVEKPEYLTILHTNDVHGRLEAFQYKEDKEYVGGMAERAALIKHIERSNKNVLTMDAGDFAQGSLFFNVFNGIPDAEYMSDAGYDVGTLGNHEFDKGLNSLKDIIRQIKYPIVVSNLSFPTDIELQAKVKPFIIKNCNGLKVAIIGLITENLYQEALIDNVTLYDAEKTAQSLVEKLNSKSDFIIVLSHMGYENDIKLAKSVPGIDVIVGGHSHTLLKQPETINVQGNKVLIVQTGEFGTNLGRLDLKIKSKKIEDYFYELMPVNQDIAPDQNIKSEISSLSREIGKFTGEILGKFTVPINIEGEKIRYKLLNSGSLVTEAIKNKFNKVDVVLQNSGGIRPSKILGPGYITRADIMNLFPFENTIVLLDLKGTDLHSVLETSSSLLPEENGGFLQSLGLEYKVNLNQAPFSRVSDIFVNGEPIESDKYYRLAVNNYMFGGGNGYSQFKNALNVKNTDVLIQDVIINYIKKNSPLTLEVKDKIYIEKK